MRRGRFNQSLERCGLLMANGTVFEINHTTAHSRKAGFLLS
jgi:hypothetical protein